MNVARNVSGVSSVVSQIMRVLCDSVEFVHIEIGSEQGGPYLSRLFGSLSKAARSIFMLLTSQYDVLHSNTAMNAKSIVRDLAIVVIARLRGKAVLLHIHGGTYVHQKAPYILHRVLLYLFHLSDCIVVLSRTEFVYFAQNYPEASTKTEFIYNGIDLSQQQLEIETSTSSDRLRIVYVGRLVPEKGIVPLIAACRMLNDIDKIDLDFFGQGGLLPELLLLTKEKAFVTYRGLFQPSESHVVLRDFDALILPSVRGEGMPMAVIEAMSVGVVPICCPISSIPEIVVDGETGLLIEIDSPKAIVEALFRLKRDAAGRRRMGDASRKFARANLDARKNFSEFNSLYQRICPRA